MPARALALVLVASALAGAEPPLVPNGGFEAGAVDEAGRERPAGWEPPDGLGVRWEEAPGGEGRCIVLDTAVSERDLVARWRELGMDDRDIPDPSGGAVAATYGLSYHSDPVPCAPGQAYRLRFRFRGPAGCKVWVRGYGELRGKRRRLYEAVAAGAASDDWRAFEHVFHPTRHRPAVGELRVMLYAYHPPGAYRFDDVSLEPIDDATYERERTRRPER